MKDELARSIASVVAGLYGLKCNVELTRPEARFGDYATNIALQLAGKSELGGRPPRQIAEEIANQLRAASGETVSQVAVAGPGFLNLTLTDEAIWKSAQSVPDQSLAGQTILTEYSDPNPFKPLHAGHLYTTLVGDTISRLLEAAGAHVVRLNYGGDVGLHVGKCMWSIISHLGGEHPAALDDIAPADRPAWLGERYVEGNTAYEDDPQAKDQIIAANKRVYAVHADNDHESTFAQIYWACRQWSYDYFDTLYAQLQVTPFDRYIPESEVTPLGLATVREQLERGVYQRSDGAVIFDGASRGLHTRVFINSQGIPTYEAKDVGLILTKWHDYGFDKSIMITANEQAQYFQVMLASVAEFMPEAVKRTSHLSHGVVKLQGGVKMSSRKGNTVTALQILDAARAAAAEQDGSERVSSEDTVLAAVKYAFAKNRIGGDIVYDPVESIVLEGNSGPYLQYAHARARSILAKSADSEVAKDSDDSAVSADSEVSEAVDHAGDLSPAGMPLSDAPVKAALQPDERILLRKLGEYAETVERAAAELMPHYICTYLYELAQTFNRFYEHNRVLGDDRQTIRLDLVERYADRLKAGLTLIGITAPDRM